MSITNNSSGITLRILSYAMILTATVLLGSIIVLFFDKAVMATTTFMGMIATFLGLDATKVLKATFNAPKNHFKKIKAFRYVFCLACILTLYVLCVVIKNQQNIAQVATILTNGTFGIMTLFLGAVGGNKILTPHERKSSTTTPASKVQQPA